MLIAMCGIDGAGKTTQIRLLEKSLSKKYNIYLTKQPTSFYRNYDRFRSFVNGKIDNKEKILCELALLSAADRMRHYNQEIRENKNQIIICDRYVYSGYAYFISRGLKDIGWLKSINREIVKPDLTFYLDISPKVALERILQREGKSSKKEETDLKLLDEVRKCFINQPWGRNEQYYIMNACEDKDVLHAKIVSIVREYLVQQ